MYILKLSLKLFFSYSYLYVLKQNCVSLKMKAVIHVIKMKGGGGGSIVANKHVTRCYGAIGDRRELLQVELCFLSILFIVLSTNPALVKENSKRQKSLMGCGLI